MATFGEHVAMFGGFVASTFYNDTWLLDSTSWQSVASRPSPSKRHATQLEWDPVRNEAVLFGGIARESYNFNAKRDTWTLTPTG